MGSNRPHRVAVIGAGAQGLCMLKNLLELNTPENTIFEAEILDSRDAPGGLWNISQDPDTLSVLPTTLSNVSRFRNTYADFPVREAWEMAKAKGDSRADEAELVGVNGILREGRNDPGSVDGVPLFLSASQQRMYFDMYVEKFGLRPHIRQGIRVEKVEKSLKTGQWSVTYRDSNAGGREQCEHYDKIILATGQQDAPKIPKVQGIERFKGTTSHVTSFKNPADFKGKRVMVVGFSHTAADTVAALAGHAEKIYLSHRNNTGIFSRVNGHVPLDVGVKRRLTQQAQFRNMFNPRFSMDMFYGFVKLLSNITYGSRLKPEWGFSDPNIASAHHAIITENLVDHLENGNAQVCAMVDCISADGTKVELHDGTSLEVDAIIFATGYLCNSTMDIPVEYSGEPALARMYQNIFLPSDPYSFAATSFWYVPTGICEVAEVMTMAIAQVFAGNYRLPSRTQMDREIDIWHTKNRDLQQYGFLSGGKYDNSRTIMRNEAGWRYFMNDAAGTGVNEKLGWGIQGLAFWATEPALCKLLMMGVDTPAVYRLFSTRRGGRKTWDRARQEVETANREADAWMAKSKADAEAEGKPASSRPVIATTA